MGRVELEIPVSSNIKSLGFRPSAFIDMGSVFKITKPNLVDIPGTCTRPDNSTTTTVDEGLTERLSAGETCANVIADHAGDPLGTNFTYDPRSGVKEFFMGDSAKPRLAIGVGVNWTSPFGPIRIDIAKAILKQDGDETKLFSFNVGTQF
jgi:outer membrane protein insertion porin family